MPEFDLLSDTTVAAPKEFDLLSNTVVAPPKEFDLLSDTLVLPSTAFALTSDTLVSLPGDFIRKTIVLTSDTTVGLFTPGGPNANTLSKTFCPDKITCECPELPLENLSSEDLDIPVFCSTITLREEPGLGVCADELVCTRFCCSETSQVDAYLCALRDAQECLYGSWAVGTCPPPGCPPDCIPECPPFCPPPSCEPNCPPNCPPTCPPQPPTCPDQCVAIFRNTQQSCTVDCPDGGTFTWVVPAGTLLSVRSQSDADFLAHSVACKLANQNRLCLSGESDQEVCLGDDFMFTIQAEGVLNQTPLASEWSVLGLLPPGITFDMSPTALFGTSALTFSGTPTIPGTYTIVVRLTDGGDATLFPRYAERSYTFVVDTCADSFGNITPDIFSSTIAYWNSGLDLPEGNYRVSYVNGAWRPGPADLWVVGDGGGSPPRGYVINNGAAQVDFPVTGIYASQALAEAATAGQAITFHHVGGKIGMHLRDFPYGDNHAGSPNPTFKLERV